VQRFVVTHWVGGWSMSLGRRGCQSCSHIHTNLGQDLLGLVAEMFIYSHLNVYHGISYLC